MAAMAPEPFKTTKSKRPKTYSTRLRAICKFRVQCVFHPKGEHDVVAYGRPVHAPGKWILGAYAPPFYNTKLKGVGAQARQKRIAIKYLDFKWCPKNKPNDRKLHRAVTLLGGATCLYAMSHSITTARPALLKSIMTPRRTLVNAYIDGLCVKCFDAKPGSTHVLKLSQNRGWYITYERVGGADARVNIEIAIESEDLRRVVFPGTKITVRMLHKYLSHFATLPSPEI